MRWLDDVTDSIDLSLSNIWKTEAPGMLQSMESQTVRYHLETE